MCSFIYIIHYIAIVQPKSLLPLLSNEEINNNNKSMKKPPDDDTSNHLDNSQKKLFNTDENSFRASSRIGDHSEMLNKQDIRNCKFCFFGLMLLQMFILVRDFSQHPPSLSYTNIIF